MPSGGSNWLLDNGRLAECLEKEWKNLGQATLCGGGGVSIAAAIETVEYKQHMPIEK